MAYVEAISNGGSGVTATRSNAFRSGYFDRSRVVAVVGASIQPVVKGSLSIETQTGSEPGNASVEIRGGKGVIPTRGQSVIIGHGTSANRLFAGRIIKAVRSSARAADRPTYELDAVSRAWDLSRASFPFGYVVESLSVNRTIAAIWQQAVPSPTSLGFSRAYVSSSFSWVPVFTMEPTETVTDSLDKLAEQVGATWYVDEWTNLHFWPVGALDPQPFPAVNTITTGAGPGFTIRQDADFAQVVTGVHVVGATTRLLEPVLSTDLRLPVESAIDLTDAPHSSGLPQFKTSTTRILVGGVARSIVLGHLNVVPIGAPTLWKAAPSSITGTGYYVIDFARGRPSPFTETMDQRNWWTIAGIRFRISSMTVASFTANSFWERAFIPVSGVGAPVDVPSEAIPAGALLELTGDELWLDADPSETAPRTLVAGTLVQTYTTLTNSTAVSEVSSMVGFPFQVIKPMQVPNGTPPQITQAGSLALSEGAPAQFVRYQLRTRDPNVRLGQRIHLSIPLSGEPGAPTMSGTYQVHRMSIGEFDELASSLGPVRDVELGPVARPTLIDWLGSLSRAK